LAGEIADAFVLGITACVAGDGLLIYCVAARRAIVLLLVWSNVVHFDADFVIKKAHPQVGQALSRNSIMHCRY